MLYNRASSPISQLCSVTLSFSEADRPAALMQIPYLLWILFAGYLNFGVWMLN